MAKKRALINTMLGAALFCTCITVAQEPVQNIDRARHPNLAEAQHLIAQANNYIITAQQDNRYDLHGHAQKARELMVQANDELKRAAEDAGR
jgi:hypothetical protein